MEETKEEYKTVDHKKVVKQWWEGLTYDQKTVIRSGTPDEQELMWNSISFEDKLKFYTLLHPRFKSDGRIIFPGREDPEEALEPDPMAIAPPRKTSAPEPEPEYPGTAPEPTEPPEQIQPIEDTLLQAPVRNAPSEMKWKAPKVDKTAKKPKTLKLSTESEAEGKELIEEVEKTIKVKPRKKPQQTHVVKSELVEVMPDFDNMTMMKLRPFAQDKGIKTGGVKKDAVIKALKKAYK